MSTYMEKSQNIIRKWYILDAADKPMGRTATQAADILRGKSKVTFTPHVDCGDFVIIINCDKAVLTGNKLDQKFYRHHSGWVGGLRQTSYRTLMEENSDKAMTLAVKGMVPDTVIGRQAMTRLRTFKGAQHTHAAQTPEMVVDGGKA